MADDSAKARTESRRVASVIREIGTGMPKRHGIYQNIPAGLPKGTRLTVEQVSVFRYGIWQVFEALHAGPFRSWGRT